MTQTHLEEEYSGQLNLRQWAGTLKYAKAYWKLLIPLTFCTSMLAVLDSSSALLLRGIIDAATAGDSSGVLRYGVGLAVLVTGLGVNVWLYIMFSGFISNSVAHDIRRDVFGRLQELEFAYYDRRPVGWLIARATSDCSRISRLLSWGLMDFFWGVLMMFALAGIMFYINVKLALIVFAVVPPLVVISIFIQRKILASSRAVRKTNSQITASFNEGISAVRTTKTLVREAEGLKEFQELSHTMYGHSVRNALQSALYMPVVSALGATGAGLALWFGGLNAMSESFSLGTMILFINCAGMFFGPIHEMARILTDVYACQASVERVLTLLATEPQIKDSPEVVENIRRVASDCEIASDGERKTDETACDLADDGGEREIRTIEFRDVCFAYKQGQNVLQHFNLTVHAGQTVALAGHTGGGKSTIVALLCRFYEPTSGQILINGVDYRQRSLHWLQSNLGIVLQTPHLFSGTVRDNIRYGRLNATDDEVAQAARLVNAEEFILGLEKGYETEVGQGGNRLSMGQKQLLSFARAVLADPQIFVMDEATSSVDTQTERLIQRGVEQLLHGRTSFVIAHRLSTIRSANRILVIDNGKIVEQGSHHELIQHRGRYFELYTNQFTQEKEEQLLHVK